MSGDQKYPSQTPYSGSPLSPVRKLISHTKSMSTTLQGHSQHRLSIKLQHIREETAKENTLALLRDTIYEGWPNSRSECLLPLCDFWDFRDLTIEDGIMLKSDRCVVPPNPRPDILKTIDQGHLGVEKCLTQSPVPLCIDQESQMTPPYLTASVKLARNTRREPKGTITITRATM